LRRRACACVAETAIPALEARLFSTHSKGFLVVKSSRENLYYGPINKYLRHDARTISLRLERLGLRLHARDGADDASALWRSFGAPLVVEDVSEPVLGTGEVVVNVAGDPRRL
jgi:hypothetical protein